MNIWGLKNFMIKKDEELDNDRNEHFYYYTKLLEDEENDKEKRAIALGYVTEEQNRKYIEKLKNWKIRKSNNWWIEGEKKGRMAWNEWGKKILKEDICGRKIFCGSYEKYG